jgi:REP element-mobilizing transposase RayT
MEFLGIGGTADHVHLVIRIGPNMAAMEVVGKVKGASAREINKGCGMKMLQWQRGYGVVSFAARDLPAILKYVENQEEHHAGGTTRRKLEVGEVWPGGAEERE